MLFLLVFLKFISSLSQVYLDCLSQDMKIKGTILIYMQKARY